ncbi:Alpha/Beta hydrolase protein [Paraphysoderma sedebokerense]|nr:Alpha/Beta hydrolase protein [Paraphysoderma sedebokerense]
MKLSEPTHKRSIIDSTYDYFSLTTTQFASHILSTTILTVLVLFSFIKDIVRFVLQTFVPGFIIRRHFASYVYQVNEKKWSKQDTDYETEKEKELRIKEVCTDSVGYYAEFWGYDHEERTAVTDDGFVLVLNRIRKRGRSIDTKKKPPILLVHGLFQSAGVFVTSGKESMAFWLADQGYDVFLGNNRGTTTYSKSKLNPHLHYSPSSKEFWSWSVQDLARYDFKCMIEYVLKVTGHDKIVYIGHSQGNAQAFLGLNIHPHLNDSLHAFIALAPAVYLGPLVEKFPLKHLIQASPSAFHQVFGRLEFIPIMTYVQKWAPHSIFTGLAFHMFSYLFDWSDNNWVRAHKNKYFRFTPKPTSVDAIKEWMRNGRNRVITLDLNLDSSNTSSSSLLLSKTHTRHDSSVPNDQPLFPLHNIKCPLLVFSGSKDYLVLHEPLIESVKKVYKNVKLVYEEKVEGYEHMDFVFGKDSKERVWMVVADKIEKL